MTLSQIMALALRQLDEDAQDVSEYEDVFRVYANIGYDEAVREYVKPREWHVLFSDERGEAPFDAGQILRVVRVEDMDRQPVDFALSEDGAGLTVSKENTLLRALCEVAYEELSQGTDEPRLPGRVHYALADYICYRHLSSGSLAKQAKAQFFLTSFHRAMSTLRPQGMGSTKDYKNLYAVTDVRSAGGMA